MNLLQAEKVAPQFLRYNEIVHDLLLELLRHERGANKSLRELAKQTGVTV